VLLDPNDAIQTEFAVNLGRRAMTAAFAAKPAFSFLAEVDRLTFLVVHAIHSLFMSCKRSQFKRLGGQFARHIERARGIGEQ
jgi:hypothetical protein